MEAEAEEAAAEEDATEPASEDGDVTASGSYGDVEWEYFSASNKLVISGTGKMGEPYVDDSETEKGASYVPWNQYCSDIEEVVVEEGVENLSTYAFDNFTSLTEVTLPTTLTEIGDGAFENCTALTSICIPEFVTKISHYAFRYCTGLRSIHIPESVTYVGVKAFSDCSNLLSFYFYGDAPSFQSQAIIDNSAITVFYSASASGWDTAKAAFSNVTFEEWDPDTYDNSGTNVDGDSIKTDTSGKYGDDIYWEYYEDSGLLTISGSGEMAMPVTITTTDDSGITTTSYSTDAVAWAPFQTEIVTVQMSEGITSITMWAFWYAQSMTTITIPKEITTIGEKAFGNCTALTDVYYAGSEEEWAAISIDEGNDCLTADTVTVHYNYTAPEVDFDSTTEETATLRFIYVSAIAPDEDQIVCTIHEDSEESATIESVTLKGPSETGKDNIYWIDVVVTPPNEGEVTVKLKVGESESCGYIHANYLILGEDNNAYANIRDSFYGYYYLVWNEDDGCPEVLRKMGEGIFENLTDGLADDNDENYLLALSLYASASDYIALNYPEYNIKENIDDDPFVQVSYTPYTDPETKKRLKRQHGRSQWTARERQISKKMS